MIIWFLTQGHDTSVVQYDTESTAFKYTELEKVHNEKHGETGPFRFDDDEQVNNQVERFSVLIDKFGYKPADKVVVWTLWHNNKTENWNQWAKRMGKRHGKFIWIECRGNEREVLESGDASVQHHHMHQIASYYCSPYENALIFSHDGGGDAALVGFSTVKNGVFENVTEWNGVHSYGLVFNSIGRLSYHTISPFVKTPEMPDTLDFAGKVMGLSAYGHHLERPPEIDFYKKLMWSVNSCQRWRRNDPINKNPHTGPHYWFYNGKRAGQIIFRGRERKYIWKPDNEVYHCYAVQKAAEEWTIEILQTPHLKKLLREHDNNLIITGGGAFNVLVNEEVKSKITPNVFVPPDPGDQNIAMGVAIKYLKDHGIPVKKEFKLYSDIPLEDAGSLKNHFSWWKKHKQAKMTDKLGIRRLLKKGKTVGIIRGSVEKGPRALGNRSILCDPSYPDARDRINFNIKNREWYRPFAPVCRKEKADQFFESKNFDNTEWMSFAVKSKDITKTKYPSVVHVDGTARLQTVTKETNPFLYDLLDGFGMLLNTSFNVAGKPILNRIDTALTFLQESDLDYVAVVDKDDEQVYLFSDPA